MRTRVLFFNRLLEGASGSDYERWVIDRDYPAARSIPSIISYEVVRVAGPLRNSGVDYDYIEVIEASGIDDYRSDLAALPGREQFVEDNPIIRWPGRGDIRTDH